MSDRRLQRIVAPHFVAAAVWERVDDQWVCIEAAPILGWMVGKTDRISAYLDAQGWTWTWLKDHS